MNNLSTIDSITASNKFDAGPAKEMSAPSFRGFFKLKGSNCTGLPQPKPKREETWLHTNQYAQAGSKISCPEASP